MAKTLHELAEAGLIDAGWAGALEPVAATIAAIGERLRAERKPYLPAGDRVLRAFQRPLDDVKVLVVGQDPYPTPGHPVGLSFSVERDVRPVPRSLANIYKEMQTDLGLAPPEHGDLSSWADQGVMLLNRVLTVSPGAPASHKGWGWEAVTEHAIRQLAPLLGSTPRVESAHPSPLSASRGFFGSRPFSRANELLAEQGAEPIDWTVR
jgi:uracil-DNA glycosylase